MKKGGTKRKARTYFDLAESEIRSLKKKKTGLYTFNFIQFLMQTLFHLKKKVPSSLQRKGWQKIIDRNRRPADRQTWS